MHNSTIAEPDGCGGVCRRRLPGASTRTEHRSITVGGRLGVAGASASAPTASPSPAASPSPSPLVADPAKR